jgi:hypothetical protein
MQGHYGHEANTKITMNASCSSWFLVHFVTKRDMRILIFHIVLAFVGLWTTAYTQPSFKDVTD